VTKNNALANQKKIVFQEFSHLLENILNIDSQEALRASEDLIHFEELVQLSILEYKRMEEECFQYLLELNKLNIPKLEFDVLFEGEISNKFGLSPKELQNFELAHSKRVIEESFKIREALRSLLGANGQVSLVKEVIELNTKQLEIIQKIKHPKKPEGLIAEVSFEHNLEQLFHQELEVLTKIDKQITLMMSTSKRLIQIYNDAVLSFNSIIENLKRFFHDNPTFGSKVLAISNFANHHAAVIALTVVSLSAAMAIGPIVGVPAVIITEIGHIFHLVATGGEGIQAIEEVEPVFKKLQNLARKQYQKFQKTMRDYTQAKERFQLA